jgi:hypothetical protein
LSFVLFAASHGAELDDDDFEIIPEVAAGFRQNGEEADHNSFLPGLVGLTEMAVEKGDLLASNPAVPALGVLLAFGAKPSVESFGLLGQRSVLGKWEAKLEPVSAFGNPRWRPRAIGPASAPVKELIGPEIGGQSKEKTIKNQARVYRLQRSFCLPYQAKGFQHGA